MSNQLARETSPYLLQHAENPVAWYPWSEAALRKARQEDKPILLSIGYSACHWCHVMAHESFEDPETAELMNRLYVNIKVDREERPDIDRIYQTAHQLFTGRAGGWPLTVFLTPEQHVPIVVGTYFPKTQRYGMPSFKEVLTQIEAYYRSHPEEIANRGAALMEAFARMERTEPAATQALRAEPIEAACRRLEAEFDREHGGFGGAPKVPRAPALELLLERSARAEPGEETAPKWRHLVTHTLDRMALGGLYDQLGGGFFRYSVDRRWAIPHFEKMLYDNAQLLAVYADAYAATGKDLYRTVAAETADWVVRDMQDDDGGYYSTLDADADGREGGFYVFTREQFDEALTPEESELAKRVFGLTEEPNFTEPHTGERAWHLYIAESPESINSEGGAEVDRTTPLLESARRKLLQARRKRVWPARDEKRLASWNGLMIGAMARAARRLDRTDLAESATRAVDFVRETLWRDGRLLATYKDGRARLAAYLDDYAFLAEGLVELLQCRWRSEDLELAVELVDAVLAHFQDPEAGGFFFTADDHERLIHRPKPFADESVPSGNGVMCRVLLTLGHLIGEHRYIEAAERALAAAMPQTEQFPDAHASVLLALSRAVEPPESVIVRAEPSELPAFRRLLDEGYAPQRTSLCIPAGAARLPGLLAERAAGTEPTVYLCRGTQCEAPLHGIDALRDAL